ncbi:unnamed protein product [Notodromas monacha]|uniref:Uncharacterized protein n=1 Tax=Notodromas monacha TaxID=399045 RepID=A0A7R9G9G7_9CRUS|nr:unnamed protein product [Notodromas monacha]CAG0913192.1 unnamed protein product [Notodromas monacha]
MGTSRSTHYSSCTNWLCRQSLHTLFTLSFILVCLQKKVWAAADPKPKPGPEAPVAAEDNPLLSCYTCVNVSDNDLCNRFAIDHPCPPGMLFCRTTHIMDSHGRSVLVDKKCSAAVECLEGNVGCLDIDGQRICVSCCDESYCNKDVPTGYHDAVLNHTHHHREGSQLAAHSNVSSGTPTGATRLTNGCIGLSTSALLLIIHCLFTLALPPSLQHCRVSLKA